MEEYNKYFGCRVVPKEPIQYWTITDFFIRDHKVWAGVTKGLYRNEFPFEDLLFIDKVGGLTEEDKN